MYDLKQQIKHGYINKMRWKTNAKKVLEIVNDDNPLSLQIESATLERAK